MRAVSPKIILRAQLVLLVVLLAASALWFAAIIIGAFAAHLQGGALDRTLWTKTALVVPAIALLVTGYRTAAMATRAPVLHAALSCFLVLAFFLLDMFTAKSVQDVLLDGLLACASAAIAAAGGYLRLLLAARNVVVPWRLMARSLGAVFLGCVVGFAILCAGMLWSSGFGAAGVPPAALGLGTVAAYVAAPGPWRVQVTFVFFGLVIAIVMGVMIHAILTHTVKTIHWFLLFWVCVAGFMNRQLFRAASKAV